MPASPSVPLYRICWRAVLLWLVLALSFPPLWAALDESEIQALEETLRTTPILRSAPLLYRATLYDPTPAVWPQNARDICSSSTAMDVVGLNCLDGHISALHCGPLWDANVATVDYGKHLSGLSHLTSFTIDDPRPSIVPGTCYTLLEGLLSATQPSILKRVVIRQIMWPGVQAALQANAFASLEELYIPDSKIGSSMMSFTQMRNLRTLVYSHPGLDSFTPLSHRLPSFEGQQLNLTLNAASITNVHDFPLLTSVVWCTLKNLGKDVLPAGTLFQVPLSLKSLTLVSPNMTFIGFHLDQPSPTELTIRSPPATLTLSLPPSLTSFTCNPCARTQLTFLNPDIPSNFITFDSDADLVTLPGNIRNSTSLTTLNIRTSSLDLDIPMVNASLQVVSFSGFPKATPTDLEHLFCVLRARPSVLTLNNMRDIRMIPSCVVQSEALTHLTLTNLKLTGNETKPFLESLPPSLQHLNLSRTSFADSSGAIFSTFDWRTYLPKLESLDLSGTMFGGTPFDFRHLPPTLTHFALDSTSISGTLPPTLFSRLPNLKRFSVAKGRLTGAVPVLRGFPTIEVLRLDFNQLSLFDSVPTGAPNLKYLSVSNNQLRTIPDDASFAKMPKLETLDLSNNPNLSGPVPHFWSNHPLINRVDISGCDWEGPLPAKIENSPRLRILRINGPGRICGDLFNLTTDMAYASVSIARQNLTGTFPSSWQRHLTMLPIPNGITNVESTLRLSDNSLQGTLPNPLLQSPSVFAELDLSSNVRLGEGSSDPPILLGTNVTLTKLFNTSFTMLVSCTAYGVTRPPFNYTTPIQCALSVATGVCACPLWATCSPSTCHQEPSPSLPPNPIPPQNCTAPPARPPAGGDLPITGATTIDGDLILSPGSSVVISGAGTLNITGCLAADQIVLEVDPDKLTDGKLSSDPISFSGFCDEGVAPAISTKKVGDSCKRVKTQSSFETRGDGKTHLSVVFAIDNSKCVEKWIILGSVLGGVLLIVVILLLVFTLSKRAKECIRPFNRRKPVQA